MKVTAEELLELADDTIGSHESVRHAKLIHQLADELRVSIGRVRALRAALQQWCISSGRDAEGVKRWHCDQCQGPTWTLDEDARHLPGCLAAEPEKE